MRSYSSVRPSGTWRLLGTINDAVGDGGLEESVLESVFGKWWPDLRDEVAAVLEGAGPAEAVEMRSERELLEEILEAVRGRAAEPAGGWSEDRLVEALQQWAVHPRSGALGLRAAGGGESRERDPWGVARGVVGRYVVTRVPRDAGELVSRLERAALRPGVLGEDDWDGVLDRMAEWEWVMLVEGVGGSLGVQAGAALGGVG